MSYSVNLWNSYNKIGKQLLSHLQGTKTLIKIFSELYQSISEFNTNIHNIYTNYNFEITTFKSLNEGVLYFKENILNIHNYLEEMLLGMKNEIILPLGNYQSVILNKLMINKNTISKIENEYSLQLTELSIAKNNFNSQIRNVEEAKLKYEYEKFIKSDKLTFAYKKEQEINFEDLLKNAKNQQKKYINIISETNKIQIDYIEKKKQLLNDIQYMEEELGELIKNSLRKYLLYQVSFFRNILYDSDNISQHFDDININSDINNYINLNNTNDNIPGRCEFIPYNSTIEYKYLQKNKNFPKEIINNIKLFINTTFNNFNFGNKKNILTFNNKNLSNIKELANDSFKSNLSLEQEIQKETEIEKLLIHKKSRREYLSQINKIRISNNYFINDKNFEKIGKILKKSLHIILNEIGEINSQENECHYDYESINLIFIIATNLYKINECGKNPRVFLQEYLKDIKELQNEKFWENIIRYFIIDEMHVEKRFSFYDSDNLYKKKKMCQKIIRDKISTYIYHMKSFDVKENVIENVVNFFNDYYELEPEIYNNLSQMKKDKNKKSKEVLIEKNLYDSEKLDDSEKNEDVSEIHLPVFTSLSDSLQVLNSK